MRPTELSTSLEEHVVRCNVCQWRCEVAPGAEGRCLVRRNEQGTLMVLNDQLISAATIGPVEDYGLLHFFPGSIGLALGSYGTPFPREQEGSPYARVPGEGQPRRDLEAERAVRFAQERLCRGVIWSYNEPLMELEYLSDGVRMARAASRYTAVVTSGYWTQEALDLLGPYLDGISLRLFGFSDAAYAQLAGVEQWRSILELAERARSRWRCHIEVTLPLHPGINDAPDELRALAGWVREQLGPLTPVHVLPGVDPATTAVGPARHLLQQEGLHYVYGPDRNETTRCHSCGWPVIERSAADVKLIGVEEGRCDNCNADLNLRWSIFKR